jgi:hypothetical protein
MCLAHYNQHLEVHLRASCKAKSYRFGTPRLADIDNGLKDIPRKIKETK